MRIVTIWLRLVMLVILTLIMMMTMVHDDDDGNAAQLCVRFGFKNSSNFREN